MSNPVEKTDMCLAAEVDNLMLPTAPDQHASVCDSINGNTSTNDGDMNSDSHMPTPGHSPSARALLRKNSAKTPRDASCTSATASATKTQSVASFERACSVASIGSINPANISYDELKSRFETSQLRLARSEARNEACVRRMNQLTQTLQYQEKEKQRVVQEQSDHIQGLQYQMHTLAQENAAHRGQARAAGAGLEEQRAALYLEMESVRLEKHELMERRKALELQCEVLNTKLRNGGEQVQKAMALQDDLKKKLDEQVRVNENLQNFVEQAQKKYVQEAEKTGKLTEEVNALKKTIEGLEKSGGSPKPGANAKLEKELAATRHELEKEKTFIKSLKEKYKGKTDEAKNLNTKVQQLEDSARKKVSQQELDQQKLILHELNAQLSASQQKMKRAEAHIHHLENTERHHVAEMNKMVEDHQAEIFSWKRKVEQAHDQKTDALAEMRRRLEGSKKVTDEMKGTAGSGIGKALTSNRFGKQLTMATHCVIIGVIFLFIYDYFGLI